jgi:hypothetical protein
MPSLSLKASVNYPFIGGGSTPPPYVPNYPPGLSGISGLIGWYDASTANTASILLNDGSGNPVSSGTNGAYVNTWKNLFLGATQGGTHLPDFQQQTLGQQATYSTSQKYGRNQLTGTDRPGIVFDGAASGLQMADNCLSALGSAFTWFYAAPVLDSASFAPGSIILEVDAQYFYSGTLMQINGGSSFNKGRIQNIADNLGTFGTNLDSMAQCGYQRENAGNNYGLSVYKDFSGNYIANGVSVTSNFTSLNQAESLASPYVSKNCFALSQYYGDVDGDIYPFGNPYLGPIGEFLVYQGTPTAQNVKDILTYLVTRWA